MKAHVITLVYVVWADHSDDARRLLRAAMEGDEEAQRFVEPGLATLVQIGGDEGGQPDA